MDTDRPLISILMAVFEPRLNWLREQLMSLNAQTYPRLHLYVRDDCSERVSFVQIQSCFQECITEFPFEIARNEENIGSTLTFERLTLEAEGDYFAYCDEDDIWLPEKLEVLERAIRESGAELVCSDMYIIDSEGQQIADSMTKVRKRHVFRSGDGLAGELLVHNFVTGCTMLLPAQTAKNAVPFCPYMVHDHYLALWCAARGSLLSIERPLVRYRVHGGNQTGVLTGVTGKESYERLRIDLALQRLTWLSENFPCDEALRDTLGKAVAWARARKTNWSDGVNGKLVWKYRQFSCMTSVFELVGRKLPDRLFRWCIRQGQSNKV